MFPLFCQDFTSMASVGKDSTSLWILRSWRSTQCSHYIGKADIMFMYPLPHSNPPSTQTNHTQTPSRVFMTVDPNLKAAADHHRLPMAIYHLSASQRRGPKTFLGCRVFQICVSYPVRKPRQFAGSGRRSGCSRFRRIPSLSIQNNDQI